MFCCEFFEIFKNISSTKYHHRKCERKVYENVKSNWFFFCSVVIKEICMNFHASASIHFSTVYKSKVHITSEMTIWIMFTLNSQHISCTISTVAVLSVSLADNKNFSKIAYSKIYIDWLEWKARQSIKKWNAWCKLQLFNVYSENSVIWK